MKKNIIICLLACALFTLLESCESKSSRTHSGSYNSSAKTDHTFDAIDKAIQGGERGMRDMGYPQLSEEMQELKYRCETLHESDACEEFTQNMRQSIRGMNQNIEETERERINRQ